VTPIVFDDSALIALFGGHPYVSDVYAQCEITRRPALFPATAILSANGHLVASHDAWSAVLMSRSVVVLDLTAAVAVAAGLEQLVDSATAHCIVEAEATSGAVLTDRPESYRWRKTPTLPFS
jgi:hypothetical protein